MKQKILVVTGILLTLLLVAGGGLLYLSANHLAFATGRCIITDNGVCLILLGKEPVVLSDRSREQNQFAGLETGDEIRILHGDIQATYPGRTGVYSWKRLQTGSVEDIPTEILEGLRDLGWMVPGRQSQTPQAEYQQVSYEYAHANMTLSLPDGWACEIVEYAENADSFGIHFWPEGVGAGKLRLEYYPRAFGVCGTGLTQVEVELDNGLQGLLGTYDERPIWDFLTFRGLPGPFSYVVCTENVESWWADYEQEVMDILNRMTLAQGQLWEADAVQIAREALGTETAVYRTDYDFLTGTWSVRFQNPDGPTVTIDSEGAVTEH